MEETRRKIAIASSVPIVPGTTGEQPTPNPVAKSRMTRIMVSGVEGSRVQGFE
jgi:hypothetical protein